MCAGSAAHLPPGAGAAALHGRDDRGRPGRAPG